MKCCSRHSSSYLENVYRYDIVSVFWFYDSYQLDLTDDFALALGI